MRETFERFPGLQLFYGLCSGGLWGSSASYIYLLWAMSPLRPTLTVPLAIFVGLAMYWWLRRNDKKYQEKAMLQAERAPYGGRLGRKLEELQERLRSYAGDPNTRLMFDASPAVLLYTLKSRKMPIVAITAGFWQRYADRPELLEAALAHEAGHVAARDVEKFEFLQCWMVILAICGVLVTLWALFLSYLQGSPFLTVLFPISSIVFGAAVALSWSALVMARELEADVYAVEMLNDEEPVRNLLLSQFEGRSLVSGGSRLFRKLATWLIQPNLQWRTSLPGLEGLTGPRVTIMLGLALAGFVSTWLFALSMLDYNAQSSVEARLTPLLWLLLYMTWHLYGFAWGRNRHYGGRTISALWRSGLDFLLFVGPTVLFVLSLGFAISMYVPGLSSSDIMRGPVIPLVTCAWAASKIALMSSKERTGERYSPGFFRGVLCWGAMLICSAILYLLLAVFLPLPDITAGGLPPGSPYLVIMPLLVGIIAHLLTPAAREFKSSREFLGLPIRMDKEEQNKPDVQVEVVCTGQLPGDVLGYMDWDNPAFGYWSVPESSPESRTRPTHGQKYTSFYGKTHFGPLEIPALFDAFAAEQDEAFRSYIVICVSRLERTQEVFADLVSRTTATNPTTRALAIRALGLFSIPAAKHELLKALSSNEPSIVRAAAGALANHRGADVEQALVAKLQSNDEGSVEQVLAALQRMGGENTERELLRLANKSAFFSRYKYFLLAALSATAGEMTRERLPQLLASGVLDEWTLNAYFGKLEAKSR